MVGLGFGDEGKGTVVDHRVRSLGARAVLRPGGGPQATHHVVLPDGRWHGFSQFGASRLGGFSGSGLRFDDGLIGRAGYSFSVAKILQLNGVVETAWVNRRDIDVGTERFTGVGFSGNIPAPWRTIINVSYGYSIASDIPGLKGESEFLLIVFKLF